MRIEETEQYFVEYDDNNTVIYKYDKLNQIECNFDFVGTQFKDCRNVVCKSSGISLSNCQNVVIGENNVGNIYNSTYITIGDNNSNLTIQNCTSLSVGNDNTDLDCNKLNNSSIGSRNSYLTCKGQYNIIGSDNRNVRLNGNNNYIQNDNNTVTTVDNNIIDSSMYVELSENCLFNEIKGSSLVTLTNSTSNKINTSKQININSTNNNNLFTKDLEITNKNPFQKYYNDKGNRIVVDTTLNRNNIADSQAIQLDTKDNLNPQVKISKHNYYIDSNKLWALKEEGDVTQYTVEIFPNPKSDYTTVSGNGTYEYNDTVRLYANVYNQSKMFSHWILCDSEGKELETLSNENPYYFEIKDNMYIYARIKDNID